MSSLSCWLEVLASGSGAVVLLGSVSGKRRHAVLGRGGEGTVCRGFQTSKDDGDVEYGQPGHVQV